MRCEPTGRAGTVAWMRAARLLLALVLSVLMASLAACGGAASSGEDPDPASALPGGSAVYVEATVRPKGDQLEEVDAFLKKVLRTDDPSRKLHDLIDRAGREEGDGTTYAKDLAPWLGRRVGLAAVDLGAEKPGYVAAIATKDAGEAKAFLARQAKRDKAKRHGDGDTTYYVDPGDSVYGVHGDFVLVSDRQAALRRAVHEVDDEGTGLDHTKAYTDAVKDLPDDRLGTFYLDTKAVGELIARNAGTRSGAGADIVRKVFSGLGPATAALTADGDKATLETHVETTSDNASLGSLLGTGKAPGLVREAPSDSLAVYGVSDVGTAVRSSIQAFAGALGTAVLGGQLESSTGVNLDRDVLSWAGDAVVFVRGTRAADLDGALMLSTTDDAKAAAAFPRLVGAAQQAGGVRLRPVRLPGADQAFEATLPGAPARAYVARGKGRVVLALGQDAARSALRPQSTLDASGAYDRAKQAAGGYDPFLLLDVQKALDMAEAASATDPDFKRARPYLEAFALLAGGSKRSGDELTTRYAATVG